MEPGPRPPHERTWRHPSEIAAAERELHASGRQRSRTLVLATSLVGVVMIGIVALVGGVATSPLRSSTAKISSARQPVPSDSRSTDPKATQSATATSAGSTSQSPPIATPVFNGSVAVVSAAVIPTSTAGHLPFPVVVSTSTSGSAQDVTGVVLAISGGVALVRLSRTFEPLAIADQNPASPTTSPPVGGGRLEPVCDGIEGSPSLNAAGELVGLCVQIGDKMTVATLPDLEPLSEG